MKRTTVVVLTVAACGRLDFDARTSAPDASDGPSGDATALPHCGLATTAPDPLTFSGTTFRFTTFTNGVATVPGVTVDVRDGATTLATATSDGSGAYTVAVPTGVQARSLVLVYSEPTYFTSTVYSDGPYDRDTPGVAPPYRWPGDAPVWNSGAMDLVYSAVGPVRDPSRGSLNVQVRDCARNPVIGVAVTITPPPGVMSYLGSDGQPDTAATGTEAPYATVFAANAQPGPTHITLSGAGLRWPEIDIDVAAGSNNTLVEMRGD